MGVPTMLGVNGGLAAVFGGGLLLLLVATWWSWAGDGIRIPQERWPSTVRIAAIVGWILFGSGILIQLWAYFAQVGVARW